MRRGSPIQLIGGADRTPWTAHAPVRRRSAACSQRYQDFSISTHPPRVGVSSGWRRPVYV
eukprot:6779106-Prymnesium_polylepis.1